MYTSSVGFQKYTFRANQRICTATSKIHGRTCVVLKSRGRQVSQVQVASHVGVGSHDPAGSGSSSSSSSSSSTGIVDAGIVVRRFYDCLNQRDLPAMARSLADDVSYNNMALLEKLHGKSAVAAFYLEALACVPDEAVFVIEAMTPGSGCCSVGVVWQLALSSSNTPMSRGLSMFSVTPGRLIQSVTESPEHPVKMTQSGLVLLGPLMRNLSGPVLPAVNQVNRALQGGWEQLFQPWLPLFSQQNSSQVNVAPAVVAQRSGSDITMSMSQTNQSSSKTSSRGGGGDGGDTSISRNPSSLSRSAASSGAGSTSRSSNSNGNGAVSSWGRGVSSPAVAGQGAAADTASMQRTVSRGATAGESNSLNVEDSGIVDLSGVWVKDPQRSDLSGYEASLDVLGLSGLQKVTARLIEGLEIQQTSTKFTVSFLTVVPFFKVTEQVPLDGSSTQQGRRDLRFGRQIATGRLNGGSEVSVVMEWGPPLAGSLTEQYTLLPDGSLKVHAETAVGQKFAAADTVYRRSGVSRDVLLANSRQRNGSVNDVIRQQKEQGLKM